MSTARCRDRLQVQVSTKLPAVRHTQLSLTVNILLEIDRSVKSGSIAAKERKTVSREAKVHDGGPAPEIVLESEMPQ